MVIIFWILQKILLPLGITWVTVSEITSSGEEILIGTPETLEQTSEVISAFKIIPIGILLIIGLTLYIKLKK